MDVIEFFAGKGRVARLGKAAGWSVLAHDYCFDVCHDDSASDGKTYKNCMDLNGSGGFAFFELVWKHFEFGGRERERDKGKQKETERETRRGLQICLRMGWRSSGGPV